MLPGSGTDPYEGTTIAGRFVLQHRIGRGGMGEVYLAAHRVLERRYAIKFLRREFTHDRRALERFLREAKAASVVDHPNIVSIYDFGQTDAGEPYLIMEYVEGVSLYQVVTDGGSRGLPVAQALDVLIQVARALRHAHERRVVHCDIKPENVLLTERDGLPEWVKVLDFGLAKIVGRGGLTPGRDGERELLGTPEFMAPELIRDEGLGQVAPPVDLYALGNMVHDIIIGSPPFGGEAHEVMGHQLATVPPRLSERRPDLFLPAELEQLTARLLDKDPHRRPSAAETVVRLEQLRTQLPPRSMRGLLLAQTVLLQRDQPAHPLWQQVRTVFLAQGSHAAVPPSSLKETVHSPPKATVLSPALLREIDDIDHLEAEVERLASLLGEHVLLLARGLWARDGSVPRPVRELKERLDRASEEEQRLGMSRALLLDRIEEERQRVQARKEDLRHQIINLSERLQLTPLLGPSEREALTEALAERERAYAATDGERDEEATRELDLLAQTEQALRAEQRRLLPKLARHLLAEKCPLELRLERQQLEERLRHFEAALAALALLPAPPAPG